MSQNRGNYNKMAPVPPLKTFSSLGNFNNKLYYLANHLAETEDWYYDNPNLDKEEFKKTGVLYQYIHHTFSKSLEDGKVIQTNSHAIMNTGLLTTSGEEIFMLFAKNTRPNEQEWFFDSFYRSSAHEIPENMRGSLPEHIDYFLDQPELNYFDIKMPIFYNMDHIVRDNFERLPISLRQLDIQLIVSIMSASAENMKKRILRNNRLVVPQYYNKKIMYLAPLKFGSDTIPLAIEKHEQSYRVNTIFTPGMAYCNARLVMKPESNWLNNK